LRVGRAATESTSGWSDIKRGFSTFPFDDASLVLKELSKAQIKAVVIVFVEAAKRALKATSDVIETHGYLLFSFSSPIAEQDPHRRMWRKLSIRLTLGVVDVIRDVVPEDLDATLPEVFSSP
jgi:2,4-dienoyl-CoA reductase-like NADH-dependent reductase (Old Yellow Enzyme family)